MSEYDSNLFDDAPETTTSEPTSFDKPEDTPKEPEAKADDKPEGEVTEVAESQGDDEAAETPDAEGDEKGKQSEKMIPEHRLKAAVKDVTEKLEQAKAELAQLKAQPAPDRTADPDGYELHIRIETSKEIMRATHDDYDEVIAHYQEMAKENPYLNSAVSAHKTPAKHAYDIAKKDREISELLAMKNSDDWKSFQTWKKEQAKVAKQGSEEVKKPAKTAADKVPNLNRATSVSRKVNSSQDDDLFKGAL